MRSWSRVEGWSREFKELTGLVSSGWALADDCNQEGWWELWAFLNLLNCPSLTSFWCLQTLIPRVNSYKHASFLLSIPFIIFSLLPYLCSPPLHPSIPLFTVTPSCFQLHTSLSEVIILVYLPLFLLQGGSFYFSLTGIKVPLVGWNTIYPQ